MNHFPDLGSKAKPDGYGILGALILGFLIGLPSGVSIGVIIAMLFK